MAGVNGAMDETEVQRADGMLPTSDSVFGPLARAQYSALIRLRWRIFVNGLRSKMGAFEFGARTVSYFVYGLMGVGLAFGAGGIAFGLASDKQWNYMPVLFWFVLFTWQVVPIMLASFQEQFNLGTLLRFPLGFKSFYFLYVVFGLSDVSTAIGALCSLGMLTGVTVVRPDLFGFTVLLLIVFASFNILLVRAIFAWIDRWLSQRKTREILAALFMIFFLSFQLVNPAVWEHGGNHKENPLPQQRVRKMLNSRWLHAANTVQEWLPPGVAGQALREASGNQPVRGLGLLALLGVYVCAAGGILGLRLRAEFSGEDLSAAPARKISALAAGKAAAAGQAVRQTSPWQVAGFESNAPSPVAEIMEKEFRGLTRALPLLYAVGAPLLMVLVIAGPFARGGSADAPVFAFPLCVFFAQLGFHQLWGNNLGTEGAGVQLYYISPTPVRTVLLGKNLFHAAVFAVSMVIAGMLATVRLGVPNGEILALTAAWLAFVLPCNLAVGNIFSLTMPYKINPGRITRQHRSQGAAFLSLALQLGLVAVGALVYLFSKVVHMPLIAIPIFLFLGAVATFVWLRIVGNADNIANKNKEQLIAALTRADD